MFFSRDNHIFEIVGVYRGVRGRFKRDSFNRSHSSIGIRLSGKSEFCYGGKCVTALENQLLYIPSMIKYSQKSTNEEFISVCFIEYGESAHDIELLALSPTDEIRDALIRLHSVWSAKERGYRLKCQAMLCEILHSAYLLSSNLDNPSARPFEILKPAMDYIYANYKFGPINISHLSGICYISETYFRRLFKEAFGTSPVAFIRALRIDTATSLLESGDFSVSEAASAVGFADAKYFSREFRRAKGISPASYLKR